MSRFSDHHVDIVQGGYPKIHDKLKAMIKLDDIKGKRVMDAGACTGSFALWAMANGAFSVLINDASHEYVKRAKAYAAIHADKYGFDLKHVYFETRKVEGDYKTLYRIDTLIARRFIYLLRDPTTADNFVKQVKQNGCRVVYLQGLVRVKNHVEPLWNVDLEVVPFLNNGYEVTHANINDLIRLELP